MEKNMKNQTETCLSTVGVQRDILLAAVGREWKRTMNNCCSLVQ